MRDFKSEVENAQESRALRFTEIKHGSRGRLFHIRFEIRGLFVGARKENRKDRPITEPENESFDWFIDSNFQRREVESGIERKSKSKLHKCSSTCRHNEVHAFLCRGHIMSPRLLAFTTCTNPIMHLFNPQKFA